jgi:hypothetical protein
MSGYTKLFNSIVTSTIWTEDDKTRIVWITMLAIADKNGEVQGSIPGLARIAGVDVESCRTAIGKFLSPDPDSRTKDDEGRRIEEIDGGWSLLNHQKYREMASRDEQREAEAKRKARYRAKLKRNGLSQNVPDKSHDVPKTLHIADTYTDTEAKRREENPPTPLPENSNNRLTRPTLSQAIAAGSDIGITPEAATVWWNTREASDWRKGTAGGGTTAVGQNWRADLTASKTWATEQAAKNPPAPAKRKFIDKP